MIVFNQQVLGFGKTYPLALADAEYNLPPEVGVVTPVVDTISRRLPFTCLHFASFRPSTLEDTNTD